MTLSGVLRACAVFAALTLFFTGQHVRAAVAPLSGIAPTNLDRTCKPCDDFYQFAAGGWIKKNPIPPSYPSYSNFQKLADKNRDVLHEILQSASTTSNSPGSNAQKIGDFYATCMDTAKIEAAATHPLDALFALAAAADPKNMTTQLAHLHASGVGGFFGIGAEADAKNSTQNIIGAYPGGLSLPDRDYYLNDDARTKAIRDAFVTHVNQRVGGTEVDGEVVYEEAADGVGHRCVEIRIR